MNIEKIFDNFNNENLNKDPDDVALLVDFSDHPLYWIGGFNKLISNYLFFSKYTVIAFNKVSPQEDFDLEKLEKASKLILFNRAWDYIKKIDMFNPLHVDCIKMKANESLYNSLEVSIKFFEEIEEYEKCDFLHKILINVKSYLPQ